MAFHGFHAVRMAIRAQAGNCCVVPRVHSELCGPHVFVMEFIPGGPILDLGQPSFCQQHGIDKHRVLEELLHAFGIMAFKVASKEELSLFKMV